MATTDDFKKALDAAMQELQERIAQKAAIEKRILQLRQVIASISAATEDGPTLQHSDADTINTDEVRNVFRARANEVVSAQDVADELARLGYHLDRYPTPLATIGTILNRMRDQGELTNATDHTGKRGFMAKPKLLFGASDSLASQMRRGYLAGLGSIPVNVDALPEDVKQIIGTKKKK